MAGSDEFPRLAIRILISLQEVAFEFGNSVHDLYKRGQHMFRAAMSEERLSYGHISVLARPSKI
jgi:hypothetical protein